MRFEGQQSRDDVYSNFHEQEFHMDPIPFTKAEYDVVRQNLKTHDHRHFVIRQVDRVIKTLDVLFAIADGVLVGSAPAAQESTEASSSDTASIEKMSVTELKKVLTDAGIPFSTKAKRPDLVALLIAADL